MVTLAFGIVVEKLVSEWTEVFGGAMGSMASRPDLADAPLTTWQWVWLGIALCAVTHLSLRNLLSGASAGPCCRFRLTRSPSVSVGSASIRYKVLAFVIAAVTCGIAGALVAQQNQYINSDFITFHLSIFILLLVLFGGAGPCTGPLLGAVMLTLIDALWRSWPSVQHFLYGALLLFALYVMPGGVAGALSKCSRRSASRTSRQLRRPSATLTWASRDSGAVLLEVKGVSQVLWRRTACTGRVLPAAATVTSTR